MKASAEVTRDKVAVLLDHNMHVFIQYNRGNKFIHMVGFDAGRGVRCVKFKKTEMHHFREVSEIGRNNGWVENIPSAIHKFQEIGRRLGITSDARDVLIDLRRAV